MAYRKQLTRLKAPYLKRILFDPARVGKNIPGTCRCFAATISQAFMEEALREDDA